MVRKLSNMLPGLVAAVIALLAIFSMATPSGAWAQTAPEAQLRIVHTVFDAPGIDVYFNGSKVAGDLAYKAVSSRVALASGSYDVKVTAAGKSDALYETNLTLENGKHYSIMAVGRLKEFDAKLLEDDLSPLNAGMARVRLAHTSPDTPAVDVVARKETVLVPNLGFADVSDYLTVDATTLDVQVRPAGSNAVALSVPGLALDAGKAYTVFVVGSSQGAPGLSALAVADAVGSPTMAAMSSGSQPPPAAAPLPRTGAADNALSLALIAMALLAATSVAGGVAVRIRVRSNTNSY